MAACRERRRLRESAGLDGKDDGAEGEQVGRCCSRAAHAEGVCPAAAHGYAVRSAARPCWAFRAGARCSPVLYCRASATSSNMRQAPGHTTGSALAAHRQAACYCVRMMRLNRVRGQPQATSCA